MALKLDMVGQTYGPFIYNYNFRDLILFALGCGAGYDGKTDLKYVYEKDQKILPMIAACPIVASEVTKTIDWGFEWGGSLHWGFDFRIMKPLSKLNGTFETMVTLKGLFDRGEGRGTLAQHYGETRDKETGELLFTNESWDCAIFDGGWGGPKAPKDIVEIPEREPDFVVEQVIPLNQACIYRLSGDYHPQHIDWEYAQKFGYPKPNLHAVSTAGTAVRHIINAVLDGDSDRLTRFKTRITKPLFPGCRIRTRIWKFGDNCVHFNVEDCDKPGHFYLNFGLVEYK